ncbi:15118_t:CDS:2 [Funneliformis mosseae]|uniref:15118_t:CDS:1 n=1 Tax=Funneliformis mosseae TaxID=27381 RepID=A0A9N9CLR1_FUNMO|nr:15118_t:CDS:2 [Funneliformis mosseae]
MNDFWYNETINTQRNRSGPIPVAIKHNSRDNSEEFINEFNINL